VIDFDSVRSFPVLQPVRRFIYGLVLCFLAALLATEAKAAWAADRAGVPSDISAVKLCPPAIKRIEASVAPAPHFPVGPLGRDFFVPTAIGIQDPFLAVGSGSREIGPQRPKQVTTLPFFSPSLFLRPPPSL